ncbi:MAG: hypothetical protein V1856_01270 [Candidatus Liptonbacteria bacterium]
MEKLRLISKTIPWWLVARAAALGLAWWFLPYGWFGVVALLLYFLPFFQPARTALPFLVLLAITFFLPEPNVWMALLLSILMFLILGVKDLLLVNRASASEALFFTLVFVMLLVFFNNFGHSGQAGFWFYLFSIPAISFFLLNHLMFHYGGTELSPTRRAVRTGTLSFFLLQLLWIVSILPMNPYLQTGLVLVSLVTAVEIVLEQSRSALSRRGGLFFFSVWFVAVVLILTVNSWSIWSGSGM